MVLLWAQVGHNLDHDKYFYAVLVVAFDGMTGHIHHNGRVFDWCEQTYAFPNASEKWMHNYTSHT